MNKPIGVKDCLRIFYPVLVLVAAIQVLLWVHWNSLVFNAAEWPKDKYAHAYLVPMFAAVLLWLRRDDKDEVVKPLAIAGGALTGVGLLLCVLPLVIPDLTMAVGAVIGKTVMEGTGVALSVAGVFMMIQPRIPFADVPVYERWIGFAILMGSEAVWLISTFTSRFVIELFCFIPALAGVFVMTGGLRIMRWAGWPIVFLIFMLPLPRQLDGPLSGRLQTYATESSTFLLQTIGVNARHVGNEIFIGESASPLRVEAACSGLRMLTIFGAISFAVALLCGRPMWQRIVILANWIPIALIVNIMRITLTGVIYAILPVGSKDIQDFFHSMWGLVMMPMALGLMFVELKILSNLIIEDEDDLVAPIGFNPPVARPKPEKPGTAGKIAAATKAAAGSAAGNGGGSGGAPDASGKRPPREHASKS